MSKDLKNLFFAILLSTVTLIGWQYFYESPRKAKLDNIRENIEASRAKNKERMANKARQNLLNNEASTSEVVDNIIIDTSKLGGTISLKGLRFDDLYLKSYRQALDKDSPLVQLFSNKGSKAYFAEFGWIKESSEQDFEVPSKNSIWRCDHLKLNENNPINCRWNSAGEDIYYHVKISIDENYLFTINQMVENKSSSSIDISNYGRIYKAVAEPKQFAILHEGAIGVFADILKEVTYEDLSKNRQEIFNNTKGSWAGFTNKYWLSALIPDHNSPSKTHFLATSTAEGELSHDMFNVNFISQDVNLAPGEMHKSVQHLFAGAKEEKLLEHYAKENNFSLFDRAIDYGIFYFITKPLLWLISYFYSIMGNFGLAIMLVTLTLKLLMYPLANKSFISMNKMKTLQPKIEQIKNKYPEDKVKFNQEIMELYKKERVNPAAGCLPLLIQIPLFFSLYKVIFISIEMRHAPFYGWIKDLSAADPTSIWNLFGLLPWGHLGTLDIGIWPLIMGLTMFIQQKLSPAPADPVQANVMKFMPLVLMVMLYSLPSGLMIYWSFSNILSILQQYMIGKTNKSN